LHFSFFVVTAIGKHSMSTFPLYCLWLLLSHFFIRQAIICKVNAPLSRNLPIEFLYDRLLGTNFIGLLAIKIRVSACTLPHLYLPVLAAASVAQAGTGVPWWLVILISHAKKQEQKSAHGVLSVGVWGNGGRQSRPPLPQIFSYRPPQAGSHISAELVGASRESKLSDFKNTVKVCQTT